MAKMVAITAKNNLKIRTNIVLYSDAASTMRVVSSTAQN